MICPYCGQENPDDIEICGFCGGSLLEPASQPTIETRPSELATAVVQSPMESHETKMPPVSTAPAPIGGIYGNRVWWIVGCVVFVGLVVACVALVFGLSRYIRGSSLFNPSAVTEISPPLVESTVEALPTSLTDSTTSSGESSAPQTPGAVVLATPELLYFDDFSDPKSGWDQATQSEYSSGYSEGAYRITVNAKMTDSWANPSELIFDDVHIEVDATKNGGSNDNDFGVICRYTDTNRFYYAMISSDGYYGISKVSPDSTVILGHENLEYSDLIIQDSATNHIRFDCVGSVLTLYVNGQLLDQQNDKQYSSGNIGLIAGTYDTPGTDILFDNFSVYLP